MHIPFFAITSLATCAALAFTASAAPIISPWHAETPADCVAASPVAGLYASGDTATDTVTIRDIRGNIRSVITRAQMSTLLPWMSLTATKDGPGTLSFSDSGRLLYILVHDAAVAGDGQPSDAVLRYDTIDNTMTLFTRLELSADEANLPRVPAAHFRGRLAVGAAPGIRVYRANRTDLTGVQLSSAALPDSVAARGVTFDRDNLLIIAATATNIYRSSSTSNPPSWTLIGSIPSIRSAAYSDQYGPSGSDGLFVLTDTPIPGQTRITRVPTNQVRGQAAFAPVVYTDINDDWRSIASTPHGAILGVASSAAAHELTDSADSRLPFESWVLDEFRQVVSFARDLISPDGEPDGWVLDADVQMGWSRFHPATPDGACWTILALLMSDHIDQDPLAQQDVRKILVRYAGLAQDGIGPSTSADGIIRHWIDPATGSVKPGWPVEFALYSHMKICLAAERAMAYYPNDPVIQEASAAIVCRLDNWDSYIQPGTDQVYLIAQESGGPIANPRNAPFSEGIIYVEQASVYGLPYSDAAWSRWINRALWPTATYLSDRPLTVSSAGSHHPAFLTMYSSLVQQDFRADPAWQTQVRNLYASSAAWTDDNGPQYFTVFSAGTTKGEWGGYRADHLGDHPGDLTTFPSLMAFSGSGDTSPAVAAYHAYRRGARQTFALGNSILYRRSNVDRAYSPDSAGLPDVVLGALGLAELLSPGSVDAILARPYSPYACPPEVDGDGLATLEDLYQWYASPIDLDRDGAVSESDASYLEMYLRRNEGQEVLIP